MHRCFASFSTSLLGPGALAATAMALVLAIGCTTAIETVSQTAGSGGGSGGAGAGHGTWGTGAQHWGTGGFGAGYHDPGCPDAGPPKQDLACDPFHQGNGDCAAGEGCFIFVNYPSEPCGQETYGATCMAAGPGKQGDACGGAIDCSPGFVCVVSGSGNQCVELCHLSGAATCAPGLVCEPIDVEGFGGCL
jgi:hypothetical protein